MLMFSLFFREFEGILKAPHAHEGMDAGALKLQSSLAIKLEGFSISPAGCEDERKKAKKGSRSS